jgi:hypothetical protein
MHPRRIGYHHFFLQPAAKETGSPWCAYRRRRHRPLMCHSGAPAGHFFYCVLGIAFGVLTGEVRATLFVFSDSSAWEATIRQL